MGNDELNRQLEDQFLESGPVLDAGFEIKAGLLRRLIVGQTIAVAFLAVMTAAGGLLMPGSGLLALMPLAAIAVIVGLVAYDLLRREDVQLASYAFLIGTAVAITSNVYVRGYHDASGLYYLWPILCGVALLDTRGGLLVTAISAGLYLSLVALQATEILTPPMPYDPQGEALLTVGSRVLMFFLLAFLTWLSSQNLNRALQRARQAAQQWRDLNESLEQRVSDRTQDLARRTRYMETTSGVAREAASVLEMDELLSRVVTQITDGFDLYRMGIFLLDPSGDWAELRAASGEGARRLAARGYRLPVGGSGIVAHVCRTGEPYVTLDARTDPMYLDAPEVADTRSEMTLPLQARGEIIGALSVQSNEPSAFVAEDISVMQTLTDQVAVAISNARLFQQAQESLEAERRAYGELSQTAWRQLLQITPELGFLRNARGLVPAGDLWRPEMETALHTGETTIGEGRHKDLAIPIRVGGRVIGVVDARKPEGTVTWATEDIELMETLAEQLSIALDSARLYQDTRRRAAQDRMLGEVTARLRETLDVKTVLETAVEEMYQSLGLDRVAIHLATDEGNGDSAQD